jgi:hypothetical protein
VLIGNPDAPEEYQIARRRKAKHGSEDSISR